MKGKKIVLGITGGIAAYKAAILVRLLVKEGAEVQVLMTVTAKEFITPLTMATLSKRPILVDFFNPENGAWNSHVELGLWADAMIVAPATANSMGKAANGIADNLMLTSYLSAKCPVFWAPAMDLDMYRHPTVQKNIEILKSFGNKIIDPDEGELASGLSGKGRMAEPEKIFEVLKNYFNENKPLKGLKALVTAGPTYENIDPVRYIGNRSSGKMGYAIADALFESGAEVSIVSGPVRLSPRNREISVVSVQSAEEMLDQTRKLFEISDIAIFAAAVADYRPEKISDQKIKKTETNLTISLTKNPDIAGEMAKLKKENQLTAGFALETENEFGNAQEKLIRKKFDFIVLNSLNDQGAGFELDTNRITIIDSEKPSKTFPVKSKNESAQDIVRHIIDKFEVKKTSNA